MVTVPPLRRIARIGCRLEVIHQAPLPPGAAIFVANHLSHLDVPMVGVVAGRPLRFLAGDGLWGVHRWLDVVLRVSGSIPLSRDRAPVGAMRTALGHLRSGGSIGVFPEGGVVAHWGSVEPHKSAAWLSLRSGAPLVPVAVVGTEDAYGKDATRLRRSRVTVTIGAPIEPARFVGRPDGVEGLMAEWSQWMDRHIG